MIVDCECGAATKYYLLATRADARALPYVSSGEIDRLFF